MTTPDVRCTPVELRLLRPLDEMAPPVRLAATRWLWDHGITPHTVPLGLVVERDDERRILVWREQRADGSVVRRWRFAVQLEIDLWPAPFPEVLLRATAHRSTDARPGRADVPGGAG